MLIELVNAGCPETARPGGDPLSDVWRKGTLDANREVNDRLVRMVTKESKGFGRINCFLDFMTSEEQEH